MSPWRREIQPGELLLHEKPAALWSQDSSELACWGGVEEGGEGGGGLNECS